MKFIQVTTDEHIQQFRTLSIEYVSWVFESIEAEYGFSDLLDDIPAYIDYYINENLSKLMPPKGHLFLVEVDGQLAGMAGMPQIGEKTQEIKRMYVRPEFRGRNVGRKLLEKLVNLAKEDGTEILRLETLNFMNAAQGLYRSFGFYDAEAYDGGELSGPLHPYTLFMECKLGEASS